MRTKIEIPAELREKIIALKVSLPEKVAVAEAARATAQTEIDRLQKMADAYTASLPALREQSVESSEAAQKVIINEARITAINGQIQKLKDQAANLPEVTLDEASVVIKEVCRVYYGALEQAIIDAISPFDSRSHLPRQMIGFFDAPRALYGIGETYLGNKPASRGNIEWLFRILDRALRGQPHLGIDYDPESEPAAVQETPPNSPS